MGEIAKNRIQKISLSNLRKHWRPLFDELKRGETRVLITQYGDQIAVLTGLPEYQRSSGGSLNFEKVPKGEPLKN